VGELWTNHWRVIVVGIVLGQFFFYAARKPAHRLIRSLGAALKGPFRLAANWCRRLAGGIEARNRELLVEVACSEVERKLERELVRLEAGFSKELREYPTLQRRLGEAIRQLEEDLGSSRDAPPELPGWPEALKAVSEMPQLADSQGRAILEAIKQAATKSEASQLKLYRTATAKRHQILSGMLPKIREAKATSGDLLKAVERALETTSSVDQHMERYEKLRKKTELPSALSLDVFGRFFISLLITGVAVAGVFVNFNLIALPMSELVPSSARIASVPVSTFAALVIVLMEITAGVFVFDSLCITELIPKIARLSSAKRKAILAVSLLGLLLLSCIEASLAVLREHLAETEVALRAALAGQAVSTGGWSNVTVIGQAVLGFILPWILALIAMPLEMLIQTARPLVTGLFALLIRMIGLFFKVVAHGIHYASRAMEALLDMYVVLPELLFRLFKSEPVREHSTREHVAREKVRT
jgi:hypothetical protein